MPKATTRLPRVRLSRRRSLISVIPNDIWGYALTWLGSEIDVINGSRSLSKALVGWLGDAAEEAWSELCKARYMARGSYVSYKSRRILESVGLVVEIASSQIRYGPPCWTEPRSLPSPFDDECVPPLLAQELAFCDIDLVGRAVDEAVAEISKTLSVKPRTVFLIVPFLKKRDIFLKKFGHVESEATCVRALYKVRRNDPSIVLDLGHFRATATGHNRHKTQRLAGAALTRYLHLRKSGHKIVAKPKSSTLADDIAVCAEALLRPRQCSDAKCLAIALGETRVDREIQSLTDLVASVADLDEETTRTTKVLVAGGAAALVANFQGQLQRDLKASFPQRIWSVLKYPSKKNLRHLAWQGGARLLIQRHLSPQKVINATR